MKLFILLTLFIITTAAQRRCPGIHFNSRYYDVEILKEGVYKIRQMVLNRNDNTIYFIYDQIAKVPTGVVGYLNMDTRLSGPIEGIRNASSISIDQVNNKVYVGGAEGVFTINSQKVPESLRIRDSVQSIFYKDVLYYTNGRNDAYLYQNGYINPVFELQGVAAQSLIIDDDNNMFFTQGKNLYRVKIGTRAVNSHENYKADLITIDINDRPYVGTRDGLYVYNKYKYVFDKVSDMSNLRGLAFSKNNEPIFAVLDTIYKLNLSPTNCFEPN